MTVETKDLWLAAYLVANGGELKEIRPVMGGDGWRLPVFVVELRRRKHPGEPGPAEAERGAFGEEGALSAGGGGP
jgi:hypothetical protein